MNVYEAGETNLLSMKSNVTIKYSLIAMASYWDDLIKIESNAHVLNGKPNLRYKNNFIG